jgi:mannan endo-1,4-beta-mannosidase
MAVVPGPRHWFRPSLRAAAAVAVVVSLLAVTGPSVAASGANTPAPLSRHVMLGAFAPGMPGDLTSLHAVETAIGHKVKIASSYTGWGSPVIDVGVRQEVAQGYIPLIDWNIAITSAQRYWAIASGAGDTYLSQVADAAKSLGHTVYLRPWPEMNGDFTPYQPTPSGSKPTGGTPAEFIAAWRHLVTLFRLRGATNVKWVFNPTTDTYPATTVVSTIWPGSAYVDVLGLDGYNWGNGGWGAWRSFHDIYFTQYARLVALDPTAPVWVCEFASKQPTEKDGSPVDPHHSKAQWYRDLFADASFGHISALVMFDIRKERDWRIESDPGAVAAVAGVSH